MNIEAGQPTRVNQERRYDSGVILRKSYTLAVLLYIFLLSLQGGQMLSTNLKIVNGSLLAALSLVYAFCFGYRVLAVTVLLNAVAIGGLQAISLTTEVNGLFPVQAYLVLNMVGSALAAHLTEKGQQQRQRLEWLSMVDGLTEGYNRRYFNIRLEEEIARAQRSGKTLGLIMVDVDNFKNYNDSFGHQAGDRLLQDAAKVFRAETRKQDIICRYGGDEFAILLPETELAEVSKVAQRIGRAIAKTALPARLNWPGRRLTLSMGISVFPKLASNGEELIAQADSALYEAKHRGKNCVQLYQPESVPGRLVDFPPRGEKAGPALAGEGLQNDRRIHGYSERVSSYAAAVGTALGVAPERINQPLFAAFLHEIGKIEVPELAYGEKGAGS